MAPDTRERLSGVAQIMARDVVTLEVVRSLEAAGIKSVVLKGPSIANWLFEEGERAYGDSDILVSPSDATSAGKILSELGFEPFALKHLPGDRPKHSRPWVRKTDGAAVDLHTSLVGVDIPPKTLWKVLSARTEPMRLLDSEVTVLTPEARTLHVVLHAAQHGRQADKPMRDLSVALNRLPEEVWRGASALARELNALPLFGMGLRFLPNGRLLADRLHIPVATTVETALRAEGAVPLSLGLHWLIRGHSSRHKVVFVARKLFPPPEPMRASSSLARRGWLGLIASYPLWWLYLSGRALPALAAYWRAWRSAHQ
jgi:hypothetical protein